MAGERLVDLAISRITFLTCLLDAVSLQGASHAITLFYGPPGSEERRLEQTMVRQPTPNRLFLSAQGAENCFHILDGCFKIQRIIFQDTWKQYEAQMSGPINKTSLCHSQSLTWPPQTLSCSSGTVHGADTCPLAWSPHQPEPLPLGCDFHQNVLSLVLLLIVLSSRAGAHSELDKSCPDRKGTYQ